MAINFSCYILTEQLAPIQGVEVFSSDNESSLGTSMGMSDNKGLVKVTNNHTTPHYFRFVKSGFKTRIIKLIPGINAVYPRPICIIMAQGSGVENTGYKSDRLMVTAYQDWRGNTISNYSSCAVELTRPDMSPAPSFSIGTYTKGFYVIELVNGNTSAVLTLEDGRSTVPLKTHGMTPPQITTAKFYTSTQKKYASGNKLPPMKDLMELLTQESFK